MQRWRPWEHSTGPRTADGKSRSARNADRGGEWRKLHEMVKTLNQAMREHRRFKSRSLRQSHRPELSLHRGKRQKNRVISKAVTEWAGYRPRRPRPIFRLSSAVFSAGWELRQFSTQLRFAAKSSDYQPVQPRRVRKRDRVSEGSANVLSRSRLLQVSTARRPMFETKARVVWCSAREGRFELGVAFLDPEDAFRARMVEQVCHIENYKKVVYQAEGRLPTAEEAAMEWIGKYASQFPDPGPEGMQ